MVVAAVGRERGEVETVTEVVAATEEEEEAAAAVAVVVGVVEVATRVEKAVATAAGNSGGGGDKRSVGAKDSSNKDSGGGNSGQQQEMSSGDRRCFRCGHRGHHREDCNTAESDYLPRCNVCDGFGHTDGSCTTVTAVLARDMGCKGGSEEDLVACSALNVREPGKCSDDVLDVSGGVLGKPVQRYIADTAASAHVSPDSVGMTNYEECNRRLEMADGRITPIAGHGDLTVEFYTDGEWVEVELKRVVHAPESAFNLISVTSLGEDSGHRYEGGDEGLTVNLNGGGRVFFPKIGRLPCQLGFRPEAESSSLETACAIIAPGKAKAPATADINVFHCTHGHAHEVLLRKTAAQLGVQLTGELHECRGCSMAKGIRKSTSKATTSRAVKKLERVFVDLSGPMPVRSIGGKRYNMIVRYYHTRLFHVFFLSHMSDTHCQLVQRTSSKC